MALDRGNHELYAASPLLELQRFQRGDAFHTGNILGRSYREPDVVERNHIFDDIYILASALRDLV